MKAENAKSLESMSLLCHMCGLFSVFLGLVVAFIDLLNKDFKHVHMGLYIFMAGYALVKISTKITQILTDER